MAIFIEHQLDITPNENRVCNLLEWHPKKLILAVGSCTDQSEGEISFFSHEGEKSHDSTILRAGSKPTVLSWNPDRTTLLAVGWNNGDVTLWSRNDDELQPFIDSPTRNPVENCVEKPVTSISCIVWSSNGMQLFVANSNGEVIIYKIDNHRKFQSPPILKAQIKEAVMCACLRTVSRIVPTKQKTSDDFEAFTSRMATSRSMSINENSTFLVAGNRGGVYLVDTNEGTPVQLVLSVGKAIVWLVYLHNDHLSLTLTDELVLFKHEIAADLTVEEKCRVKLSGKLPTFQLIITEPNLLAICSHESRIRLWDFYTEESCVLNLHSNKGYDSTDLITTLSYCQKTATITAGTCTGRIATWKRSKNPIANVVANEKKQTDDEFWKLSPMMKWSKSPDECQSLAVSFEGAQVVILKRQSMLIHLHRSTAAIQLSPNSVSLLDLNTLKSVDTNFDIRIAGVHISEQFLSVWDGNCVVICEIADKNDGKVALQSTTFTCSALYVATCQQNVYCLEPGKINVRTSQGTVKQILTFPEVEGDPVLLDISGNWMSIVTSNGFVRIYDLSRREAKQQYHSKCIVESVNNFSNFVSVKVNCDGSRISCTCRLVCFRKKTPTKWIRFDAIENCLLESRSLIKLDGRIDSKLIVFDAESDSIFHFSFDSEFSDQHEYEQRQDGDIS